MNDRLDDMLTQHRRHLAHQQRELYEHNLDDPCPCGNCERERFEHRVVKFIVAGLLGLSAIAWLVVSL
jgi:hypothetical protein